MKSGCVKSRPTSPGSRFEMNIETDYKAAGCHKAANSEQRFIVELKVIRSRNTLRVLLYRKLTCAALGIPLCGITLYAVC
jgi:hypothetical protein